MRRRPSHLANIAVVTVVLVAVTAAGCAGEQPAARSWTADVKVEERKVVIVVDVPGWHVGADYHPHFSLNGGPEVMAYTEAYTFFNLKPGTYTVRVTIAEPGHLPIRGMEKHLKFTVPSE